MLGSSSGLDVARRREVVVVLGDLFDAHGLDETLDVLASMKGGGDFLDGIVRDKVLRSPFLELAARVDQDDLASPVLWFLAIEDNDDAGGGGVVKKVVWK